MVFVRRFGDPEDLFPETDVSMASLGVNVFAVDSESVRHGARSGQSQVGVAGCRGLTTRTQYSSVSSPGGGRCNKVYFTGDGGVFLLVKYLDQAWVF